jgi:hypothetical protein
MSMEQTYLSVNYENDTTVGVLDHLGKRYILFALKSNSVDYLGNPTGQFTGVAYLENTEVVGYVGLQINGSNDIELVLKGEGLDNYSFRFSPSDHFGRICDDYCPEGTAYQEGACVSEFCHRESFDTYKALELIQRDGYELTMKATEIAQLTRELVFWSYDNTGTHSAKSLGVVEVKIDTKSRRVSIAGFWKSADDPITTEMLGAKDPNYTVIVKMSTEGHVVLNDVADSEYFHGFMEVSASPFEIITKFDNKCSQWIYNEVIFLRVKIYRLYAQKLPLGRDGGIQKSLIC